MLYQKSVFAWAFLAISLSPVLAQEAQVVKLPECRTYSLNANYFCDPNGHFNELHPNSESVWYSYKMLNGERVDSLKIYDAQGQLKAYGIYENNRLKDEQLYLIDEALDIVVQLDYDCPGWFFHDDWARRSGKHEHLDGKNYVWLAGQRYRMPKAIKELPEYYVSYFIEF